ncbi:hypothetical protein EV424DRAFT_1535778 [Suillus variegatus]|nr:hypothetical protein EV424DRAFT_1535778 [Suillus variegatus]
MDEVIQVGSTAPPQIGSAVPTMSNAPTEIPTDSLHMHPSQPIRKILVNNHTYDNILELIFSSQELVGRSTVCYLAKRGDEEYIIKDHWILGDKNVALNEVMMLQAMQGVCSVPQLIKHWLVEIGPQEVDEMMSYHGKIWQSIKGTSCTHGMGPFMSHSLLFQLSEAVGSSVMSQNSWKHASHSHIQAPPLIMHGCQDDLESVFYVFIWILPKDEPSPELLFARKVIDTLHGGLPDALPGGERKEVSEAVDNDLPIMEHDMTFEGAILDAPARTSQLKGTTSLNSDFPMNPLAPELPRKGHGSRSKIKQPPPPYTTSETLDSNTTVPRPRPKKIKKIVAPSLSLETLNNQPTFVQCESQTSTALNNPFMAAAKAAKEQHAASHNSHLIVADTFEHHLPAAPSNNHLSQQVLSRPVIVNLSDDNLDPTLQSINQGDFRPQDTDTEGSDASKEGSDSEDTSDRDNNSANQQIGWGESRGRHNAHPGFSEEHSWDEDDQAAGRTLAFDDASGSDDSETGASQPADVLELHHKKNGCPHLPDPALLDLLCGAKIANTSGSKKKATKASKDPGDGPKSTQLAWYGPHWKCFLEEAKGECCVLHTLENAFPKLVPDLSTSITESLSASLVKWIGDGNQVEADVWPTHKPDMARLLYDDLSTWWSDLKKIVVTITPSVYGLIPPTDLSTREHANWVKAAAADLLDKSKYLCDAKDELGKTKNFAHPGLCKATILFIYIGSYRIAHRRPDIFCKQIPLNCLALVATVVSSQY